MSKKQVQRVVRVECTLDGHEEDYIEYDVTDWSMREFRRIPFMSTLQSAPEYIEPYSIDWHITGKDGEPVPHPGRDADIDVWMEVWGKIDITMADWIGLSVARAVGLASTPPKS